MEFREKLVQICVTFMFVSVMGIEVVDGENYLTKI